MEGKSSIGYLRGYWGLLALSIAGLFINSAWAQSSTPRSTETHQGSVEDYQAQKQKNVLPSPEIPRSREEEPPSPPQEEQSQATASAPVNETMLWSFLRQQRYQKVRQELRRLQRITTRVGVRPKTAFPAC